MMLYKKILNAHNLRHIKAFGGILHNDFVYKWDDRVENRGEWLAETPRLWEPDFKYHKQILIMENEDFLVTEHPDPEQGSRDVIVRMLKGGKIIKQYVKHMPL